MMGYINNLLIGMVEEAKGEAGVETLFKKAAIARKSYQNEVIYPEEQFQSLFIGAQAVLGVDSETAEKAFARYCMRDFQRVFPWFFTLAPDARAFFEKVPMTHRNFPATPSATTQFVDKLCVLESTPERLVFRYCSPNRLCVYLCTLAFLALEYYEDAGEVEETNCMKKGADHCRITIRFAGKRGQT